MKLSPLTAAEEQLMQVIWPLERPYLRDIMQALPEPKSHQNTVSTYLKILIEKDYLRTEKEGRIFRYIARVDKETYVKQKVKNLAKEFFEGSLEALSAFMGQSFPSLEQTPDSSLQKPTEKAASAATPSSTSTSTPSTEPKLGETKETKKAPVKKTPRKKYEAQIAAFVSGLEKVNKKKEKKSKSKKSDSKSSKKKDKKDKKEKKEKGSKEK